MRVPAYARRIADVRMVVFALHSAWRPPDVAQHRSRTRAWRQRELSGSVPTVWRLPRRRARAAGIRDDAGVAGHWLRRQVGFVRGDEGTGRVSHDARRLASTRSTITPD